MLPVRRNQLLICVGLNSVRLRTSANCCLLPHAGFPHLGIFRLGLAPVPGTRRLGQEQPHCSDPGVPLGNNLCDFTHNR
ncbi:hypothetical protein FB451DRAFT_1282220 [Mycena latifolia]|nr:hypothetical protein FB451DRAFT_1282220 [Mycena latifolia]